VLSEYAMQNGKNELCFYYASNCEWALILIKLLLLLCISNNKQTTEYKYVLGTYLPIVCIYSFPTLYEHGQHKVGIRAQCIFVFVSYYRMKDTIDHLRFRIIECKRNDRSQRNQNNLSFGNT